MNRKQYLRRTLSTVACVLLLSICSLGCQALKLRLVDASVEKPSNVVVYFTVDTREGEPVPGLTADKFNIYEDDRLISLYESKQTILNPEVATERYTLLLLDMSGSVVESGQVPLVQQAVDAFVSGIGAQEKVAIYAFDGREKIFPVAPFSDRSGQLSGRASRLSSWRTKDPSTNLNGAIIEAVKVIEEERASSDVPLRFGNLVVFTDGTDRAHRANSSQAIRAVRDADISMFVIGLGGEVDQEVMTYLGRDGFVEVQDQETIVQAFEDVALHIQALASRFYLLSYCSPARAGIHELEVEAVHGERRGKLSYTFDAENFEPNCNPNKPPSFNVPKAKKQRRKKRQRSSSPKQDGINYGSSTMDFEVTE